MTTIPQRDDTWEHRENSAVTVTVTGRQEDRVRVTSESSFINGTAEYPIRLFVREFKLTRRPGSRPA